MGGEKLRCPLGLVEVPKASLMGVIRPIGSGDYWLRKFVLLDWVLSGLVNVTAFQTLLIFYYTHNVFYQLMIFVWYFPFLLFLCL